MARAEFFAEAKLRRIFQEESRTEIGTFDHVKPAHGLRQIERRFVSKAWGFRFGNSVTEIGKVLLDHGETAAAFEIGQQAIKRFIGEKRIEVAMEKILRFHEFAEVLPALERLRCHDEGIETTMRATRGSPQALHAALLDLFHRR
ncbi:hypothetical protein D3C87_1432750 [compost metagenome]